MADIFRRNKFWAYDFRFRGRRYQGSTFLKNKELAKAFVAKLRSDLALGLVGLTAREPAPILSEFLEGKFLDSVRQNAKKDKTRLFYEQRVKRLVSYIPFQSLRLDQIDELAVQGYKDWRLAVRKQQGISTGYTRGQRRPHANVLQPLSVATINGELRTLRKALIFADDCGLIKYRRVRTLPGERNRMFVLDGELENLYLSVCEYPLKQVAILMLDLGLRPEEAVSLRKADVSSTCVNVPFGKTANARRALPQTERTREVFELCNALFPESEWVFPGKKGQHYSRGAICNLHIKTRNENHLPKEFVLYSARHTFASRLAQSGANAWEICKAMGHSSVKVSEKYIHPSSDSITLAFRRKELLDKAIRGEVHTETSPEKSRTS